MKPTIGRIVLYVMTADDATRVNDRREAQSKNRADALATIPGTQCHVGNHCFEGQILPADVVAVWGEHENATVNLQVKLDGSDTHWVTSRARDQDGKKPGTWHWMDYQIEKAVKADAEQSWTGAGPAPDVATGVHSRCGQSVVLDGGEAVGSGIEAPCGGRIPGDPVTPTPLEVHNDEPADPLDPGDDIPMTAKEQPEHPAAEEEQADAAEGREA